MKRILALLLVLLTLFPLAAACGKTTDVKGPEDTESGGPVQQPAFIPDDPAEGELLSYPGDVGELPAEFSGMTVTPVGASGRTVTLKPSFSVTTSSPSTAEKIAGYAYLVPETKISVTKVSDTEFRVDALEKLPAGNNVRFCVGSRDNPEISFAFETETDFCLSSSIPGNGAEGVPVNSGIELVFSEKLKGGQDISRFVEVTPSINYKAEVYPDGKTLLLLPEKELEKNTLYKINVRKELASAGGKTLSGDLSLTFLTSSDTKIKNHYLDIYGNNFTPFVSPGKETGVVLRVYCSPGKIEKEDVSASLYAFSGIAELKEKLLKFSEGGSLRYDTAGMSEAGKCEIENDPDLNNSFICRFTPPTNGAYLLEVTATKDFGGEKETVTKQYIIQASNGVPYAEFSDDILTVYMTANGEDPVGGITVRRLDLYSDESEKVTEFGKVVGETDNDGLCRIPTDKNGKKGCLLLLSGPDSLIVPVSFSDNLHYYLYSETGALYGKNADEKTCSVYLYTDREKYFASDRINFAGFTSFVPEDGDRLWYSFTGTEKMPLEIKNDGSFSGSYELNSYSSSRISLSITNSNGKILCSKWLGVTEEDKPKYTASLTLDKEYYRAGETVNAKITASYFDGTPAPDLRFIFRYGPSMTKQKEIVTDGDGVAIVSFIAYVEVPESPYPQRMYCSSELIGTENTRVCLSASAPCYHFDTWLRSSERKNDNGKHYTEIYTNELDLDGFPDDTVGKPVDKVLSVTLTKTVFTRKQVDQRYDAIEKVFYPVYKWSDKTTTVKTEKLRTVNGSLRLDCIEAEENTYYRYRVGLEGLVIRISANEGGSYYSEARPSYSTISSEKQSFKIGETVSVALIPGSEAEIKAPVVSVYYKGGCDTFKVVKNSASFVFKEEYVAKGAYFSLVYFDHRKPKQHGLTILFDPSDENLDVTVETDRDVYRPSDKASVKIKVKDANGSPAANARIILSVVDEACFAMADQNVNALRDYYQNRRHIYVTTNSGAGYLLSPVAYLTDARNGGAIKYSNTVEEEAMDYEAPSGRDESENESVKIRKDFADNPLFTNELVTDGNGVGEIVFTVPDNITKWRITAIAQKGTETDTLEAFIGNASSNVIATLPVFLNVETCDAYVKNDGVSFSYKFAGTSLPEDGEFEVVSSVYKNGKLVSTKTENGKGGLTKRRFFDFGELETGSYKVVITAKCGEYTDGVEYPFSVVDSAVGAYVTVPVTLDKIKEIDAARYPVNLTFFDPALNEYASAVYGALNSDSSRADAKAAAVKAAFMLKELTGKNSDWTLTAEASVRDLSSTYFESPYFRLLPYASGSLELTSRILSLSPEAVSGHVKDAVGNSLENVAARNGFKSEREIGRVYLALASLGKPVLNDVLTVVNSNKIKETGTKLDLAFALALLGDYPSALKLYGEIKKDAYIENGDGTAFIKAENVDESIALTSTAMALSSKIAQNDAVRYAGYLKDRRSALDLFTLEQLFCLSNMRIKTDGAKLQITRSGETKEITLKAWNRYSIDLDSLDDFEASSDGQVAVLASYYASKKTLSESFESCDEIKLTKEVFDIGDGFYRVDIGYSVTTDKDSVSFRLSDTLPSGVRYFGTARYSYGSETYAWISSRSGRTLTGSIYVYRSHKGGVNESGSILDTKETRTVKGTVSYTVRVSIEGSYTVEEAVAVSRDGRVAFSNAPGKISFK